MILPLKQLTDHHLFGANALLKDIRKTANLFLLLVAKIRECIQQFVKITNTFLTLCHKNRYFIAFEPDAEKNWPEIK